MLVPAIAFSWWLASVPMGKISEIRPPMPAAARTPVASAAAYEVVRPDGAITSGSDDRDQRVLYRGLITPAIASKAREFLDLPMGAERAADVEGHHFVFVLQRHYHPPGFVGAPTGWHKGVTVFEVL
jgi:hypothetical protein